MNEELARLLWEKGRPAMDYPRHWIVIPVLDAVRLLDNYTQESSRVEKLVEVSTHNGTSQTKETTNEVSVDNHMTTHPENTHRKEQNDLLLGSSAETRSKAGEENKQQYKPVRADTHGEIKLNADVK